jgi:hypothetical protein
MAFHLNKASLAKFFDMMRNGGWCNFQVLSKFADASSPSLSSLTGLIWWAAGSQSQEYAQTIRVG